jgi:hypothetical protein
MEVKMTEETLSYEYSFVCNENEVRIVMTAGLLNRLLQSVGGIQGLDEFMLNPEIQEKFLKTILQDYDEKGNGVLFLLKLFTKYK